MTVVLSAFVTGCLMVSLAGLLLMAGTEARIAENHLASTQALALAESGLEVALWRLNSGAPLGDLHAAVGAGAHDIHVDVIDPWHVVVTATGEVRGAIRTVSNTLSLEPGGRWQFGQQFRDLSQ